MKNVYNHASFTNLMSSQIKTVILTMVLAMINLKFGTIITKTLFAMDITNRTPSSQNISRNSKRKTSTSS